MMRGRFERTGPEWAIRNVLMADGLPDVPDRGAAGGAGSAPEDRRSALRSPVIRGVKLALGAGQSVLDCLVLDESATGIMVDLGALVPLPEEVTVHLQGGASYRARRRWMAGTKAGLEFLGAKVAVNETAQRMHKLADLLHTQGPLAVVGTLRAARYFDQAELRRAADEAEAAYLRLEALLIGR